MVRILVAHEVAKRCFLFDALLYRAVGRIPLASVSEDEVDAPGGYENLILTPEECRVGGLPPDPEWEESEKGEGEDLLNATVAATPESEARKLLYIKWLKWKGVQEHRRNEWCRGLREILKRHHNEFRIALHEGRLRSQGQRSGLLTKEDIADAVLWQYIPLEPIPSTFWSSCEIDWEKCQAKGSTAAFDSIVVDTVDLFRVFPLPTPEVAISVSKCGDYFVVSDDVAVPTHKSGRPPFPWDEFHLELARRVVKHELYEKQDSVLKAMHDWCESQWGISPGDSTLKQKLKPYYDEFVWPEKVRK
jgi:hypothetical protein